jgi:hypothetical protein
MIEIAIALATGVLFGVLFVMFAWVPTKGSDKSTKQNAIEREYRNTLH